MEDHQTNSNQQLFVSLKLEDYVSCNDDLTPHVYGSVPLIGSWESSNALSMQQQGLNSTWQLSFFVPLNQESLDFKFVLKPRCSDSPCIVEEGDNRFLREDAARVAVFKNASGVVLGECRVFVEVEKVSMFDLAACWRAYHGNIQHSVPQNGSASSLKPDGEYYMDSASGTMENSALVFAANCTETPRSITHPGTFASSEASLYTSHSNKAVDVSVSRTSPKKEKEHIVPDHSQLSPHSSLGKSKSAKTVSPFQEQERSARAANSVSGTTCDKLEPETKNSMPAAAGAVEAAAVADQMLGPKEDRHLAIVLVGLPARGKTFTSAKLTRYLRWLGHETKHFNVGKYRRVKHGANLAADFFRADNPEGVEARNEVAAVAMEDMIAWFQDGGQVGIFDATNSTRVRRNMLMKMAEGKCKIIFLETICNDERIIERNIRLKIQSSPDYTDVEDFEAGVQDFKTRLANYEKVYEPVEEGSYIKMIDMASGQGGQIQVNNISGYLPGRIVFFLVNTHLTPHPILLTRHGESQDNVRGRIGGDTALSEAGELYSKKLADFLQERLEAERTASIWTSTLQRTILSAEPIKGYPKIQWRALEEINAGVCDGMTYAEIKENMPEEYESRKRDKLRYRYPRGESYLDIIQRLEPVIIELERQRAPVVVISHQAVLRALYAYFADRPLKEIPHIEVPLHTITEIQMGVTGVEEKRYKLMD